MGLNSAVVVNCEYMSASSGNNNDGINNNKSTDIKLGVFRYSVDNPGNQFDTGGECIHYDDPEGNAIDLEWQIQTAQDCAIIAPICGIILVIVVLLTQCCCPIPCMGPLIGFCYLGCLVGTALVWMVRLNEVCDTVTGGCEWGDGAVLNLCAQLVYILAAIFHRCLPGPKVSHAERRANRAERQQQQQQQQHQEEEEEEEETQQHEAEMGQAAVSSVGKDAEVKRLQSELDRQKQATQTVEQATAVLQAKYDAQTEELKKQRNLLAAATVATGTTAGVEAAKIKKLQEKLEEKDKLLQQNKHLLEKQAVIQTAASAPTIEISGPNEAVEVDLSTESAMVASGRDSVYIDDTHIDDSTRWHKTSSYAVRIHHKLGSVMLNETDMTFICTKDEGENQTFSWSSIKKIKRNRTGSEKALLKITASSGEATVIQLKNRDMLNDLYKDAIHWLSESSNESSKPDPPDTGEENAAEPAGQVAE